ncbi:MAG: hypothetical protein ACYDBB_14515 [Armatimonadota bacterium]
MIRWTDQHATRIWRTTGLSFIDEVPQAAQQGTDAELARIAAEGFTGIWVFCEIYDLMQNTVFPELNRPGAAERLASLQALVERARRHGIGVYLYFNEPMGVPISHPFWQAHPELKGVEKWSCYSLCTSMPPVLAFFRDAVESVFAHLQGVEGVVLITGSEGLTHCWSKHTTRPGDPPTPCPRCQVREPAELVLELLDIWAEVSRRQSTPFHVLAWNWEWSLWYPDPQLPIIDHLPAGAELLLGFEMGGTRQWQDRTIFVGEYALSFPGPAEQFVATCQAVADRNIPVHAKIELNGTHELCSIPNVPVLQTIHHRFATMAKLDVAGFMGCWSMCTRFTLNTFALTLYLRDPARFVDEQAFLDALAREYFGCTETAGAVDAWRQFSTAFTHYPFSVNVLYNGPHNDAPARRMSLRFEGKPIGRSYMPDPPGDDLSRCVTAFTTDRASFTLDEVIDGYSRMHEGWVAALQPYADSLRRDDAGITEEQRRHRHEELGCAQMIGIQLRSIVNVYRFFREQQRAMQAAGLTAPCDIPANEALLAIMAEEIANIRQALPLLEADPRLGYHQDIGGYKYNAAMIREKIAAMEEELCSRRL